MKLAAVRAAPRTVAALKISGGEGDEDNDCTDYNICNGEETCVNNNCVAGPALNCNDGSVCTDDSCDSAAGCQHVNNSSSCDDGSVCTEGDYCSQGACGGTAVTCDDADDCTTDTCNPVSGCVFTPVPGCECDDDSDCSDNDVCTGQETCNGQNQCVAGTPLNCDDGNVCTEDS